MAFPWLRVLDAVIGFTDIARSRRIGQLRPADESRGIEAAKNMPAGLDTRLAGVVVAALKEAFDRDTRRLDLEREQMEAERLRAERAMRLELLRQTGEREISRLRHLAAIAAAAGIGTLFLTPSWGGHFTDAGARFTLVVGWLMVLGSIGAALMGQSQLARELVRIQGSPESAGLPSSGGFGTAASWLLIGGLAIIGVVVIAV